MSITSSFYYVGYFQGFHIEFPYLTSKEGRVSGCRSYKCKETITRFVQIPLLFTVWSQWMFLWLSPTKGNSSDKPHPLRWVLPIFFECWNIKEWIFHKVAPTPSEKSPCMSILTSHGYSYLMWTFSLCIIFTLCGHSHLMWVFSPNVHARSLSKVW